MLNVFFIEGGSGMGKGGRVEKIIISELKYKKNQSNIWGDRGKAAGLFIRVGLFAGGFFGSRLFCLRLFSWQAFL